MTPAQWNEYQRQADVIEQNEKRKAEQERVKKLAEQSWERCDGCDENDKYFFMKGFRAGYNRANPDVISDEEIEKASYKFWEFNEHTQSTCWKMGAKWYREKLKKQ